MGMIEICGPRIYFYNSLSTILNCRPLIIIARTINIMNRPVRTRIQENLNKYDPTLRRLAQKHQEFSETISLVWVAASGLAKYHRLFTLEQHGQLIHAMRLEDDYSRNVTLIGLDIRKWSRNPDLTLRGKDGLNRLYVVLELVLRDAIELYSESEKELRLENKQINLSASDGLGEYQRARAALWKFQHEFHLHQIDSRRGRSDRAIFYEQPGYSGLTVNFGDNPFPILDWKEPDEDYVRILTEEEQTQLKNLISMPEVQKLLPKKLRNRNIILPPDEENDGSDIDISGPKYTFQGNGILKAPGIGPLWPKKKKSVRFGRSVESELPSHSVHDGPPAFIPVDTAHTPPAPPPPSLLGSLRIVPSSPRPRPYSSPSHHRPTMISNSPSTSSSTTVETSTDKGPKPPENILGVSTAIVEENNTRVTCPSTSSSTTVESTTDKASTPERNVLGVFTTNVEDTNTPDTPSPAIPPSSSTSSSMPSVGSLSPTPPSSVTENGYENSTASNSSEDENGTPPSRPPESITSEQVSPAKPEVEVRREIALSFRAYLGFRHDEYSQALEADSTIDLTEEDEDGSGTDEDDAENLPYHDEAYAGHHELGRTANHRTARAVRHTALFHWASAARAKRAERIQGYTRLRKILKWAEAKGKVPLSPSSIRASTGLRRGIFTPLGPPDLPPAADRCEQREQRRRRGRKVLYGDVTMAALEQLRPRLDLTLSAFLFNEDALRLFGGLVGEQPRPSDLARMDKILRELVGDFLLCARSRYLPLFPIS